MPLAVNVRHVDEITIVDLAGRLASGKSLVIFREAIHELLKGKRKRFLINLQTVTYVDFKGAEELISGAETARRRGGDLKIFKPNRRAVHLFRFITAFFAFIETFEKGDEEEAIASFHQPTAR